MKFTFGKHGFFSIKYYTFGETNVYNVADVWK
jgi:hypothetical protein